MQHAYQLPLIALILALLNACYNPDKNKKVDPNTPTFSTSDQSEMFFKNVRQLFYDKIDMPAAKLEQYRIKERPDDSTSALIGLVLVNNWMADEAYILVEPNAALSDMDSLQIFWRDTLTQATGKYDFVFGRKENHYILANQLYHSIQEGHELEINKGGERLPFMPLQAHREPFRKTMVDFLRLVNVLK